MTSSNKPKDQAPLSEAMQHLLERTREIEAKEDHYAHNVEIVFPVAVRRKFGLNALVIDIRDILTLCAKDRQGGQDLIDIRDEFYPDKHTYDEDDEDLSRYDLDDDQLEFLQAAASSLLGDDQVVSHPDKGGDAPDAALVGPDEEMSGYIWVHEGDEPPRG